MRHWNKALANVYILSSADFYSTYEALKLLSALSIKIGIFIFTLPMRHWNSICCTHLRLLVIIFTLPMRHWNSVQMGMLFLQMAIFTLPMRHWNCCNFRCLILQLLDFYSTYEALKRFKYKDIGFKELNFYSTYEALKLLGRCWDERKECIFTLPMRHWNSKNTLVSSSKRLQFLLYLWGIETKKIKRYLIYLFIFLLYLWGIETAKQPLIMICQEAFLLYLWGIETYILHLTLLIIIIIFTLPMRHWNK